ncbi:MAG: OmpA family protein [Neisseriaceae bacterium]|nr:OmpA family protein [Neisseriaceae bacterium]MBP6860941.1 OmpA family protein [Neisseriaceae bacterium]
MNTKTMVKLSVLASALLLSACGSLKDVNNSWCPAPAAAVPAPASERINVSADALFKFDRSDLNDMLPEGRQILDELVSRINQGYVTIASIDLTGHTDRLGPVAYNQKLGLARAQTVHDYLKSKGINAAMTVNSAGASDPVTTDCVGNKATTELKACLQPDRRVTLDIKGVKKTP